MLKHQNFSAHSPAAAEKVGHLYYLCCAASVTVIRLSSVCESVSVVKDALALVWPVCMCVCREVMLVCTYCTLAQHTGAAEAAVRGGCEGVGEDNVVMCV